MSNPWDNDPIVSQDAPPAPPAPAAAMPWDNDPIVAPQAPAQSTAAQPDPGQPAPLTVHASSPTIDTSAPAAAVTGALDGIPVVGPTVLNGLQHALAWARSNDYGTDFSDELAKVQGADKTRATDHPYATTAGNIAGGVVGTAPLIAAAPAAFGIGDGALAARALTGAGTGAVLGGADAGARSDGTTVQRASQVVQGAGIGALFGGAAPAIGSAIGSTFSRLTGAPVQEAAGIPTDARQYFMKQLKADDPATVLANMKALGPEAMTVDYGPALRGIGQGLATKPGAGQQAMMAPLIARDAATNARLGAVVDRTLGPDQSPLIYQEGVKAQMAPAAAAQRSAIANAPAVDVQHIVDHIDTQLPGSPTATVANGSAEHSALVDARRMLTQNNPPGTMVPTPLGTAPAPDTGPITNARQLLSARRSLDDLIDYNGPTLAPQSSAVRDQQGVLQKTRGMINDALREQVPGYAAPTDELAGLSRRVKAVDDGTQTGSMHPQEFAQLYNKYVEQAKPTGAVYPTAQPDFAVGQSSLIRKAFGTKENDLQALRNFTQGDQGWNYQNTALVHGPETAKTLQDAAQQNLKFRESYGKIVENSESARNLAAAKGLQDAEYEPMQIGHVHNLTMEGIAATAAKQPINAVLRMFQKPVDNTARDLALAKISTAQGADRNAMLAQILRAQNTVDANAALGAPLASGITTAGAVSPAALAAVLRGRQQGRTAQR